MVIEDYILVLEVILYILCFYVNRLIVIQVAFNWITIKENKQRDGVKNFRCVRRRSAWSYDG